MVGLQVNNMDTIKLLEGCSYSMEINGKEFVDLSKEEARKICHKLIDNKLCDTSILQKFIEDFLVIYGDYKDLGHCEQCSEYSSEYTLKI